MDVRAFLLLPLLAFQSRPAREGEDLLGKPAPSIEGLRWIGRGPSKIEDFRGKVVLVRWWTDGCVLCERSAPAIRELTEGYGEKGLVEIAKDAKDVVAKVETILSRPKDAWLAKVDRHLAASSWDKTWASMHKLMLDAAGDETAKRPASSLPVYATTPAE